MNAAAPDPTDLLPPSRRGETAAAARAAAAVAIGALLWIGGAGLRGAPSSAAPMAAWQRRFADLEPALQRALRELHEGAVEALRLRGEEGSWPDVDRLAADGVPPFADDGVDRGRRRFVRGVERNDVQYAGLPARDDGTRSLLLRLLEPLPGDPEGSDPRVPLEPDEQHRRLADGTLLHVSFWIGPERPHRAVEPPVRDPAREGWTQVLSGIDAVAPPAPPWRRPP